ncbi:MAG TPA: hypothetical protein VF713_15775, partial [Thermoanaerobaculia bacterium]
AVSQSRGSQSKDHRNLAASRPETAFGEQNHNPSVRISAPEAEVIAVRSLQITRFLRPLSSIMLVTYHAGSTTKETAWRYPVMLHRLELETQI